MSFSFLADENIPRVCVIRLREAGIDVSYIGETSASIPDIEVCSIACSEHRIIITGDKDFGDLVMRHKIRVPGVILLRLKQLNPNEIASILLSAVHKPFDWEHHFAVLTKDSIRIRKLTFDV